MNANNRNRIAVMQLRLLDFPLSNIRKSLSKLTGIEHSEIAKKIGVTRQTVTLHICGHRNNPKVQQGIAGEFDIPVDEIFERKESVGPRRNGDNPT